MKPTLRTLKLWIAATALAAFGAASVASYRPDGVTDRALALESLKRALAALNDEALDSTARLTAYRDGLSKADEFLHRALRSNLTDTASIERLAMVRWESGVLEGSPDPDSVSAMIAIAATRAPRVPEIQAELGDLLYRMGRTDEATPFMKRAVELSPSMTNRVVGTMQAANIQPDDIVDALPPVPDVLIAVKDLFIASGRGSTYLDRVERQLVDATPSLLMAYGDACLQLGVPARLRDRIVPLPSTQDPTVRAARLCQAAHALLSLGEPERALTLADEARRATPADPQLIEFYGEVALACGRSADAEVAFRQSLELVLTEGAGPARRARLYDALGRSLEAQGRADFAFDAFRRAIEIDPTGEIATARLATHGYRSSSPPR